jgi:hypothetical protein
MSIFLNAHMTAAAWLCQMLKPRIRSNTREVVWSDVAVVHTTEERAIEWKRVEQRRIFLSPEILKGKAAEYKDDDNRGPAARMRVRK